MASNGYPLIAQLIEAEMNIVELLALRDIDDFEMSAGGIQAMHRPDVAPLAYEVRVIASAYSSLIVEELPNFLDGANLEFFKTLYRCCNGLHIGATKFGVFGFITGDQSIGVPWDIELPNDATRDQRPKATLVIGTSIETDGNGTRRKCYHTLMGSSEIKVTPSDDFSADIRSYKSVESWLKSEVSRALDDRTNW